MFGLGDRLVQADPATLLVGASALAGVGALAGAVAGRLGADGPALRDRLRPPTVSLAQSYAGPRFLDEVPAHATLLRFAPNLYLPSPSPQGAARLRLFGHVGGWLVPVREVDPRPQFTEVPAGQDGTATPRCATIDAQDVCVLACGPEATCPEGYVCADVTAMALAGEAPTAVCFPEEAP